MTRLLPLSLFVLGIGHALLGPVLYWDATAAILRDGYVAAVSPFLDRQLAFWFILFGPILALLGLFARHALAVRDGYALRLVGWAMVVMGALGGLAIPVSGFWACLAVGVWTLVVESREARAIPA